MNTIIILLLILLCIIISYFLYTQITPNKSSDIKDLYAEGLDMLVSGKRYSAYNNFKNIIEKDSNNIMAYIRLGQVLRESGNYMKAIKIHKNVLIRKNLSPYELIELHKNLSKDYIKINNLKQSIEECLKILEIEKSNEWAITQIIRLYKLSDDWENAIKYLKLYFDITGKSDNHKLIMYKIYQSKIKIKNKDFLNARSDLEKALHINNENPLLYYFLAKTYSEESNIKYNAAIEIEKKGFDNYSNEETYNNYVSEAKDILAKAIPLWTHFCEIIPNQSWLVFPLLKDALFVLDRYSEMEKILDQLYEKYPDNIEILTNLADYYSHKGEFDKALEAIDKAIAKDDKSYIAKLIKSKLLCQKVNNEELINNLDELINSLIKNERFQILNSSNIDKDYKVLFEFDE